MSSLGTLALGSTSSAKVSRGFWNASCQELSKKLWLPTKTECVSLASSPWSTSLVGGSWFKTTLFEPLRKSSPRISLQSSTSNASTASDATVVPSNPSLSPLGPTSQHTKTKKNTKTKTDPAKRKLCSTTDCDTPIDPNSNGYLCETHYDPEASRCQGVSLTGRNKGQRCSYASTCAGFCGHHAKKTKVDEDEKVEENVSCRRYRLRPHRTQVQLLRQWFGVAREYYNATIEYLVKEKAKAGLKDVRPVIKDKLDKAKAYPLQVPDKIRQGAIQDACRAMSNAKLKYQQDRVFSKLKFWTRRDPSQSIYMDMSAIKVKANAVVFYPQITKTSLETIAKNNPKINPQTTPDIRTTEPMVIKGACRVVMKHNRYFQLASPQIQQGYEGPAYGECASLDPGGRSFLTLYSPDLCGHLGYEPKERIEATYHHYDKNRSKHDRLKNRLKGTRGKERARLKNRMKKLRKHYLHCNTKITRIVDDLHWKSAKFLCENFQTVLLGKLETKQ
ncbi:hypothetical protein HK102_008451, partial [Quaeritorhiza haematococci]